MEDDLQDLVVCKHENSFILSLKISGLPRSHVTEGFANFETRAANRYYSGRNVSSHGSFAFSKTPPVFSPHQQTFMNKPSPLRSTLTLISPDSKLSKDSASPTPYHFENSSNPQFYSTTPSIRYSSLISCNYGLAHGKKLLRSECVRRLAIPKSVFPVVHNVLMQFGTVDILFVVDSAIRGAVDLAAAAELRRRLEARESRQCEWGEHDNPDVGRVEPWRVPEIRCVSMEILERLHM